ncbi:MAG: NERD domain-containing protein, partial [Methanomicrobiaceae archaeon]|nr:NERD domain-containing protein [Methanomicrobiaceae archaeon]
MWPRRFPHYLCSLPERNAERKVYRRLAEDLEDDFVVFYSRPWLGMTWDGREIDGECDFIIAHPGYGYLALEVKGGGVAYDPVDDRWQSRDRHGNVHTIKDPIEQARRSKHEILRKLTASVLWKPRFIRACHAAVFPDVPSPGEDLGADMPLHIFCFHDDLAGDLRGWIVRRFEECADPESRIRPLGEDGIRALESIFARPFQLNVPLGMVLEDDDTRIRSLTPLQYHILAMLQGRKRVAISGAAGTGKTVLAMEEAVRCASRGLRVLLTCYNRALGLHMQKTLSGCERITIGHYHGFCTTVFREAGISLERNVPGRRLFLDQYPEALITALELLPDTRFDAIIIDEGQDFPPGLIRSLASALDPDGENLVRFFYDDNQNVYGNTYEYLTDFFAPPFPLTANLRNTRRIHDVARRYYSGNET